jgi:hypothetical protein
MGSRWLVCIKEVITLCAAASVIAVLWSCEAVPTRPVTEKEATAAVGYGRAFGRIVVVQDGKEKTWSTALFATDVLNLYVRSTATGRMQQMQMVGDGSFVWPLQAGDYVIVAYADSAKGAGRLWTTFSIPQPGQAVYIGDLRIVETTGSRYGFFVEDQYEEALKKVEPQLVEGKLEPVRGLMKFEQDVGTYNRVRGVCAQEWGITCDKQVLGVEPVLPVGALTGYPIVPDLTPLLEWKPSIWKHFTYDVAIYESLLIGAPGAPRVRGALVTYAQGLIEPRFKVSEPLEAGKNYEWSVRLRDDDTVSTWSVTNYFVFFVVGSVSSRGQWFGLSTPTSRK